MHVHWFVDNVDIPDYDYAVDSLKGTPGVSLETFYLKVLCEDADVAKPKQKDQNALTPREIRIRLPEAPSPSPHQLSNENIDTLKHKKESGTICVPQDIFNTLSKNEAKELKEHNASIRRSKNKRKVPTLLPGPPPLTHIQPRNNDIHNKRQKACASKISRQGMLDDMQELDGTKEIGTDQEISQVTPL